MDIGQMLSESINQILAAIVAQFALLNWPLIVSGAGIGEVIGARNKKRGKEKLHWAFPLIMGAFFGIPQYLQHAEFKNILTFINGIIVSAATYSGLIVVMYFIILKPLKAISIRIEGKQEVKS